MPTGTISGLDMLLVELYQVGCEEDLINLSFNTISIAEFQGRWFLGLWAGRFINVRAKTTLGAETDTLACMLAQRCFHLR
jgi:hypothetical protein